MSFDPTIPQANADLDAVPIRDNFNALKTLIDAIPTGPQSPGGAAGGDLGGTYPNPTVQSIANVTTGPAVYPAGSAANLTNVPAPPTLSSGVTTILAFGTATITVPGAPGQVQAVVCGWNTPGAGSLSAQYSGSGTNWIITSSNGASDMGQLVNWIAF